ncbi:MAG: hypothetical protein IT319_01955 [Anaerolineae bacterium]|nr:hypothetical protein [Anaerolineae bacterium]
MNGNLVWRNASLDELLAAGKEALAAGDSDRAHEMWRAAAVANPYDERVWTSLLDVLTEEADREVCLENIIAINPLNPDARRELRALRRERRIRQQGTDEPAPAKEAPRRSRRNGKGKAAVKPLPPAKTKAKAKPAPRQEQGVLARALLTGVLIGLFAVVLGIVVSIVVYGGVLNGVAL